MSTERTRTRVTPESSANANRISSLTSVLRGNDGAVGERDVLGEAAAEQRGLDDAHRVRVGVHLLDPDTAVRVAVDLPHDQLLRDVDETARQVAGVGGTERGVGETLARAVRRDEVLEHRQTFTEVRLDRARDDLTTRVRHETAHTGDLTHLHDVSTGTRVDHHVDRVERRRHQEILHGLRDLVGRVGPDLDLLLAPLVVGDDAALVLVLDLGRFALELLEQSGLRRRRRDVGHRDRQPGTRSTSRNRVASCGRGCSQPRPCRTRRRAHSPLR